MLTRLPRLGLLVLALGGASPSWAEDRLGESLSLQGYSGLLNVPSGWASREGTAHLLFTNQEDSRFRFDRGAATYVLSASPVRYLEAGLRLTEAPGCCRDLSLNLKLQAPLDLLVPDSPVALAIGIQDFGGAAAHFRTSYAVLGGRWRFVEASLGYGLGPDRLKGPFGGLSLRPLRFLELLADYDTVDVNAGLRLSVPFEVAGASARLAVTAKTALTHSPGFVEWGVGLQGPLDLGTSDQEEAGPASPTPPLRQPRSLEALQAALIDAGFEDVRVGRKGDVLILELENNVLPRAELDAIGVALGLAASLGPDDLPRFSLFLLRRQVPLARVSGPTNALRSYFEHLEEPALAAAIEVRIRPPLESGVEFLSIGPIHRSSWRAQVTLQPAIRPFIGTEVGVFDAVFSVRPEGSVSLWRGASVYARWDIPVAWTKAFAEDGPLSPYRGGPKLEYALLYQALPIAPAVTALVGAGIYRTEGAGGLGEIAWTPGQGAHAFAVEGAWTRTATGTQHASLIGSWRWTLAAYDAVLAVRGGQFYLGDRGVALEASRYFGDVQVGAFYSRAGSSVLGAFLTVPLSPWREMNPALVQLRGARRWATDLSTVVQAPDGSNNIRVGVALPPTSPYNLETSFFDGSRLTGEAITEGLPRARHAFERFRKATLSALRAGGIQVETDGKS